MILIFLGYLLLLLHDVSAFDPIQDEDLVSFVTLPQARALKWDITYYDRSAVAPGYWFVAPYYINAGESRTNRWIPCQIGAHIFDQDGELVWTGSCDFEDRNIYDFRMVDTIDKKPYLAMILLERTDPEKKFSIIIYDNEYQTVRNLTSLENINGHEINIKDPSTALAMVQRPEWKNLSTFGEPEREVVVGSGGFVEFDIMTGKKSWEWYSGDAISLDESFIFDPYDDQPRGDYVHVNSADKNRHGDYLLSARHTDAIYLISGQDGHIIWRLGGKKNDFEKDFEFSGQHHARFISVNDTHQVLSFLNNGARDFITNQPISSAMYVELDTVAMKATILNQYNRPDGGSTNKRGNVQTLPNNNVLVSWSINGYMSEFTHDGKLLMDARFSSTRFSTYRAYKFPWLGRPSDPPTLVSSWYGVNGSELSTVFYVSWNGATDVKYWRFYAQAGSSQPRVKLETIPKTGFETSYIAAGYMDWVSVEALDEKHEVMGTSQVTRSSPPEYWPQDAKMPQPDDPATFNRTYFARVTSPSPPLAGVVSVVLFIAGVLTSAAGFGAVFFYPAIRNYARRTYTNLRSEEPEEERPLNSDES